MSTTPPPLEHHDTRPGRDFTEKWAAYLEDIYTIYLATVAFGKLCFRGHPVSCQHKPEAAGKHYAFWHMMQEGAVEDARTPDLERCRRVHWISWMIAQAACGNADILVFPQQKRGTNQPWAIWCPAEKYLVVLWERKGYYLLKTAFVANKSGKIAELTRDAKAAGCRIP